jgi:hypothetical protein
VRHQDDLSTAMLSVEQALGAPRRSTIWRWIVKKRVVDLRKALDSYEDGPSALWLAPRRESLLRERRRISAHLGEIESRLSADFDPHYIRARLSRLLHDIDRHRQRAADLVYDTLALDLGGVD